MRKMLLQIFATRFTRKREREEWEGFGQHKLALRIDVEMRRGRHSFLRGREDRPLLDEFQVAVKFSEPNPVSVLLIFSANV
jgi:hypothetical protein